LWTSGCAIEEGPVALAIAAKAPWALSFSMPMPLASVIQSLSGSENQQSPAGR
jgi:hypothetical protein